MLETSAAIWLVDNLPYRLCKHGRSHPLRALSVYSGLPSLLIFLLRQPISFLDLSISFIMTRALTSRRPRIRRP